MARVLSLTPVDALLSTFTACCLVNGGTWMARVLSLTPVDALFSTFAACCLVNARTWIVLFDGGVESKTLH
jgi:hypothetical protein